MQLLSAVIANYENAPATYFYLGLGEYDTGKTSEAAATLEKALAMHPDANLEPRIEYQLARVYRKLGRNADADQAIHEYTRLKAQTAKQNSDAQQKAAPAGPPAPEQQDND
jgi:tetratricopeptide (TPR) repeat protein